ncbi:MAG: exodeoxyribonuclease VII small subunit, partial [Clostridia bacterium]|nr:exodeoxyribonuclease VII small subunit [Clostridia bacterium]
SCELEKSLDLYEEGRTLAGYCSGLLNSAEKRIEELSETPEE